MFIKTFGLRVLLVDGKLFHSVFFNPVFQKLSSKALAPLGIFDKEHLKGPFLNAHEGNGLARIVLGYDQMGNAR